ncbi:cyclin E-interacting protein minus [Andrena cerasifolii]|uniref:cyclin E-interacting protein minus n=1 Tax=Andrena cerasifolii TaxID=2819439 RepID=UPI0040377F4D
MDCCYFNRAGSPTIGEELPSVCSPEMFDSDGEDDSKDNETLTNEAVTVAVSPEKPSQADLLAKSDHNLLARINKFLSGVPPPPKHTICRTDCTELLLRIYENHHLFWTPCVLPEKQSQQDMRQESAEQQKENISTNNSYQRTKSTPRNLSTAFDACDPQYPNSVGNSVDTSEVKNNISSDNFRIKQIVPNDQTHVLDAKESTINTLSPEQVQNTVRKDEKQEAPLAYTREQSIVYPIATAKEATSFTWPEAYLQNFHGIHYNRSKTMEEFENLTSKLCERYIGAETQSTCTIWFSKHAPGSAKKRNLLAKRDNGQSPGKRLNHLTRRRRTFSSANLQGLALNNKRLLVLNIKKPTVKKGKSPRGKSPRGKSPRGTPRSSTKKRVSRRLVLDTASPLKSKVETSKRALFQSPPSDRAGPSKLLETGSSLQTIKRVLFAQKAKENDSECVQKVSAEESRKRKSEEELEGPRYKWAKSLSFDCPHELHNNTLTPWDRHSSSNIIEKNKPQLTEGRNELSDVHRKKLLWAVAEALRGKGIGMTHPQFKQHATNLARTIKKLMPDLENRNIPRKPGSTSDRMLKLAKHHVLFLIDARPTD